MSANEEIATVETTEMTEEISEAAANTTEVTSNEDANSIKSTQGGVVSTYEETTPEVSNTTDLILVESVNTTETVLEEFTNTTEESKEPDVVTSTEITSEENTSNHMAEEMPEDCKPQNDDEASESQLPSVEQSELPLSEVKDVQDDVSCNASLNADVDVPCDATDEVDRVEVEAAVSSLSVELPSINKETCNLSEIPETSVPDQIFNDAEEENITETPSEEQQTEDAKLEEEIEPSENNIPVNTEDNNDLLSNVVMNSLGDAEIFEQSPTDNNNQSITGDDTSSKVDSVEEAVPSSTSSPQGPTFTDALMSESRESPNLEPSEPMEVDSVPLLPESTDSTLAFSELKESNPPSTEPTESPESLMEANDMSKTEVESIKSDKNIEIQSNDASLSNVDHMSVVSEDIAATNSETFEFNIKKQLAEATQDADSNDAGQVQGEKRKADDTEENNEDDDDGDDKGKSTPTSRRSRKRRRRVRERGKFVKDKPDPALLDEETRMELPQAAIDEDSQGSTSNKREVRRFRSEIVMPETTEKFTAEKLVEYQWPHDSGDHYFIQEHVSEYLGIMSFKRKYPHLRRHPLEMQERDHLKEMGIVSEIACDLGLTAVRSEDVLDVMFTDFPDKFEELQELLRDRHEKTMKEQGKVDYLVADLDKSKIHEYSRQAAESAARWNATLNRERKESRRYNFDMQTFTLQIPQSRMKAIPAECTKLGSYPVAVLPGQYTDFFKHYSMDQLRYFPLNTIVGNPEKGLLDKENSTVNVEVENKTSSSKEETKKPEATVKAETQQGPKCKNCNYGKERNKLGTPEPLVSCSACKSSCHLTCVDLDPAMVTCIQGYAWKCMDCKACEQCNELNDEEKMIFCDMCDRGYHIYCVGLRKVPTGRWHCKNCAVCSNCGTRNPAGREFIKNAEWAHEFQFKKDKSNKKLKYATTLCMPCDKYWKRRQFCYICLKVYKSIPEDGMVRCSTCPKYIHKEVCSTVYENERYCNNCYKTRNSTALNHSRILAAAKRRMAMSY